MEALKYLTLTLIVFLFTYFYKISLILHFILSMLISIFVITEKSYLFHLDYYTEVVKIKLEMYLNLAIV